MFLDLVVKLLDCEAIEKLYMDDGYDWCFDIQCTNCHFQHDKQIYMNRIETVEGKNNRVSVNFYMKCKNCKRDMSVNIDPNSAYRVEV